LELRILTSCIGSYPQPPKGIMSDTDARSTMTTGPPNPVSPFDFTCLLRGPLEDFLLYSGQERSRWLMDIAHDLCDPAQKRGTLRVWDVGSGQMWRSVNHTDPLTASVYLYDIRAVVALSKISQRAGKSKTKNTTGHPSTMANRVKERDGYECWVTRMPNTGVNSHVLPKRMGDHLLRVIYGVFVSTPPPGLSIDDEICGITLFHVLDSYFDTYELGLRPVAPGEYICHSFLPPSWPRHLRRTIYGTSMGQDFLAAAPSLHGYRTGPPQP
ncbi:hypothetical protein BC826DRAFT_867368, partial [Russula brevipes]